MRWFGRLTVILCLASYTLTVGAAWAEAKLNPDGTYTVTRDDLEQCVKAIAGEKTWKAAYLTIEEPYKRVLDRLVDLEKEVETWKWVSLGAGIGGLLLSVGAFLLGLAMPILLSRQ